MSRQYPSHVHLAGKDIVCVICGEHEQAIPEAGLPLTAKAIAAFRKQGEAFIARHEHTEVV
jgi:hypothetical protein